MDKFWDTKEGKILSYAIHQHSGGTSLIGSCIRIIEREEDISREELLKQLDMMKKSNKRCQDAIDYIYTKFKEIHDGNSTNGATSTKVEL